MKLLQFLVLSVLLGNPLLALFVLVVIYWALDRYTLGLLPDPFRFVSRWRRAAQLRSKLRTNPHDRRTRLALADTYLELRRPGAAFEAAKPNVEAGDHDPHTLFVAGRAAFGAGEAAIGDRLLEAARDEDPTFAQGRVDLELGRGRLDAGDAEGAKEALERFVAGRSSAIEGNVLLARARARLGDAEGARSARSAAWQAYREAPRFLRRRQRWWAWRANPARPLLYLGLVVAFGATLAALVIPQLP